MESESGARAYFEDSGVGRKKFEESENFFEESGVGVGNFFFEESESVNISSRESESVKS